MDLRTEISDTQAGELVVEESVKIIHDEQEAVSVDIPSAEEDKDGLEVEDIADYDGGGDSKQVLTEKNLTELEPVAGESDDRSSQMMQNFRSQLCAGEDSKVAVPDAQVQVSSEVEDRLSELEEELSREQSVEVDLTEQEKVTSKGEDTCSELNDKLSMEMCSETNEEGDRDQVDGEESLVDDLKDEIMETQRVKLNNVVEDETDGSGKLPGTLNSEPEAELTLANVKKEELEQDGNVIEDVGKGACAMTRERGVEPIIGESKGDSSNSDKNLDTGNSTKVEIKMNFKSEKGDKSEIVDTSVKDAESQDEVMTRCEDEGLSGSEGKEDCAEEDDRNLIENDSKVNSDIRHLYKKSGGKNYQLAGGLELKTLEVKLERLKMPVYMAEGRKSAASSTSSIQTRSRARAECMEKTGKDYKGIIQVTAKKTPDPLVFKKSKKGWKRYIKKKAVFSDDLTKLYEKSKRLVDKVQSNLTVEELKHKCNKAYCSAIAKPGDRVNVALKRKRNSRNVRFAQTFERFAYEYVNPAHFMFDNRPFSERFDNDPSESDTSEEETDGTESLDGSEEMDDDTESKPGAGKCLSLCSGELDPYTGEVIGNTTVQDELLAGLDNKCSDPDGPSDFTEDSQGVSDSKVEDTKENVKAMVKSSRQAQASDGNIGNEHSINPLTGDLEFTDRESEEVSCEKDCKNDCENDTIEENKPLGKTCVKDTYTVVNSESFNKDEQHYIDRKKQLFAKWKKHVEKGVKLAMRLKDCEDSGKGVYKHDSGKRDQLSDKCIVVMKSMLMLDMEKHLVRALEETKQLSDIMNGTFLEDIDNVEQVIQVVTEKMTAKLNEILYPDVGKSSIKYKRGQEGVDEILHEVTDEVFARNSSAYKAWKKKQTNLFEATEKEASWLVNVNMREKQVAKGYNMECFERSSTEETQKRKEDELHVTMKGKDWQETSFIVRKKVKQEKCSVEGGTVQTEAHSSMAEKEARVTIYPRDTDIREQERPKYPRDTDIKEQERSRLNLPIKKPSCEDMLLNLVVKEAEKLRELNRMEQNIAIKKNILASIAEAGRDPSRQIPGQSTEGTDAAISLAIKIKQEPDDSQDWHKSAHNVKIKTEMEEFESNEPSAENCEEDDNNPVPTFLVKMNPANTSFMVYPADSVPELGVLETPITCFPEAGHEQTELKNTNKRLKREVPGILKKRPKLDVQTGAGAKTDSKVTVSGLDLDKLTRMTRRDVDKLAEHIISKYDDIEDAIETQMPAELKLPIPVDHTPVKLSADRQVCSQEVPVDHSPVGLQTATIPTTAASARASPGLTFPTIVDHTASHAGPARQTVCTGIMSVEATADGTVRDVSYQRVSQYVTTIGCVSNQQPPLYTAATKSVYKRQPPSYTAAVMAKSTVQPPKYTAATTGKSLRQPSGNSTLQPPLYNDSVVGKSTVQPPKYTTGTPDKSTVQPSKLTAVTTGVSSQQPPQYTLTLTDGSSAGQPCVRQLVPSPPGLVSFATHQEPTSTVAHMVAASGSGTARGASPQLTVTVASGASTGQPNVRQLVVAPKGLVNIAPRPAPVSTGPSPPQYTTTVIDGASSYQPTVRQLAPKNKKGLRKAGPSPTPVVPGISSPPGLVNMAPKLAQAMPVGQMVCSPPGLVNMAPNPAPDMPGLPTVPPGGGLMSSMQLYQQGGQQYVALATNQVGSEVPQQMLYKAVVVPGSSNCYLVPENPMVVQGVQNVQPVVQGVQNIQSVPQQSQAPMLMLVPNTPVQTQLVPTATTPQPASLEPEALASLDPEKDTPELQPKILNVFSMKGIDLNDEVNAKMGKEKETPNAEITGIETIESTDNSTIICQESAYCVIAERDIRSGLHAYGRITKRSNKSTDLVEFSFLLTKVLEAEGITLKKAAKQSSNQSNRPDTSDKEIVAKVVDALKILRLAITVEAVNLLCAFLRKIADMKSWLITIPNLTQILFFVKRYAVSSFNPAFFTEPRQPHRMYFWTCQICAKSCKSKDTFLKHTKEHRRFLATKMKELIKEHVFHHGNRNVCLFCKTTFTTPVEFYIHFKWPCSKLMPDQSSLDLQTICQSKFTKVSPTFDAAYFSIKLPYPELFKCKICLKTFSNDDALKEHLLKDHEGWHEVQLLCSKCDINFQHNPVEFFDHVKLHQVGDEDCPFQCLVCQATFWFSLSLTVHHRISHKRGKTIKPATVVVPESATGADVQVDVESLDEMGSDTTTATAQDDTNVAIQCTTAVVSTEGAASADKHVADDFDLSEDFRTDMEKRKTDLEMKKLALLMELKKRKEELKKIVAVRGDETDSPVKNLSSEDGATEPVEGNKGSEQLDKSLPTGPSKCIIPKVNYWSYRERKRQQAAKQKPRNTKKAKVETESNRAHPEPTSQYKVITDDSYLSQIPSFDEVMSSLQQRSSKPVALKPPVAVVAPAADLHPTVRGMLGGPTAGGSGDRAGTVARGMRSTYSVGGSCDRAKTKAGGMRSTYSAAEVMGKPDMFRELTGVHVELKRLHRVE